MNKLLTLYDYRKKDFTTNLAQAEPERAGSMTRKAIALYQFATDQLMADRIFPSGMRAR